MRHGEHDGMDAAAWDESYRSRSSLWSGEPNAQLVTEATVLRPGSALDIGCGEGADAVWLALRGWEVTAVDISEVALGRARAHAQRSGVQISFERVDVVHAPTAPTTYDLVSAQYLHLPDPPRGETFRAIGQAVSPGGTLIVVGHQPGTHGGPDQADRFYEPAAVTSLFDPDEWDIVVEETRSRRALHHQRMSDLVDAVAVLRRVGTLEGTI